MDERRTRTLSFLRPAPLFVKSNVCRKKETPTLRCYAAHLFFRISILLSYWLRRRRTCIKVGVPWCSKQAGCRPVSCREPAFRACPVALCRCSFLTSEAVAWTTTADPCVKYHWWAVGIATRLLHQQVLAIGCSPGILIIQPDSTAEPHHRSVIPLQKGVSSHF
ncbi:hypothetical protein AOLI_G00156940 [Acnodon oligacanthus]